MGSLRESIQKEIEESSSPEAAALAVCVLLEREIGLEGNGWFDDDATVRQALRSR